jgi:hypothetical protein
MAKEVKKRPIKAANTAGRTRNLTKKQAKTKAKRQVRQRKPIIGSFKLTGHVFRVFTNYWKTLGGIVLVYLFLNVIFASGVSNISNAFASIKDNLNAGGTDAFWRAAGGFASLIGSSGTSSSAAGSTMQSVLFIVESMVIIWALRHLLSGQKISVKQAYYSSSAPLVPFLLTVLVIIIQLLPVSVGATVLAAVATSVFTNGGVATAISLIAFLILAAWSIYMVSASIFAIYIVTLPEMQPRQALRSAVDLVRFRRWIIIRRVFFMPLFIVVIMGLIIVPLILFAQSVVPAVFYILSMLAILFAHTYLYSLYRDLLE